MPRQAKAVDVDKLLELQAGGMGIGRLAQQFSISKIRVRKILDEHGIFYATNVHRPSQDVVLRSSGNSSLRPCMICGRKGHPVDLKCWMCGIVMHPEWEQPGPWWAEKQCQDCAARLAPETA